MSGLKDPGLLRQKSYIDGEWRGASSGQVIEVSDPASLQVFASVPDLSAEETTGAIEAAEKALAGWQALGAYGRADLLHRWADLMAENREDLSLIMTREQGKPLDEARGEIDYALAFLHWFAEEGKRHYGETIPSHLPNSRLMTSRQPIGVTAAVTPWNFPSAMITRKAGAALGAGCVMVVRPASETPYSALALAELAERAGIPKGVFSVVTGDAATIVGTLMKSPAVKKVSFTGSTEVGRLLLQQGAGTVKKLSMELGGHAPFIVTKNADLDLAVSGAVGAKFATTGQDCLAVNKCYVHESLYEDFCTKFTEQAARLKMGNGLEKGVEIGPMMNEKAVRKCEEHVADALDKGATLLLGGKRGEGLFFAPTVLCDVTRDMTISQEETFGPVMPISVFSDLEATLEEANDTIYGLAAYIYSRDLNEAWLASEKLDYGMVAVNTPKMTGAPIPFGGVKQSGLGREGSCHGLDDYTEIKYVCFGNMTL